MNFISAIVLAAGRGSRLKSRVSKPLIKINRLPMLVYSLRKLGTYPRIKEIVLVANKSNRQQCARAIKKYGIKKVSHITNGGARRQDSVYNGLKKIDGKASLVLIHDSARPFIDNLNFSNLFKQADAHGAAIVAVPLKATVKYGNRRFFVKNTLNRDELWETQTPQVFERKLLLKAYRRFGHINVTDDSALIEKLGVKVKIVPGEYFNLKITTPEDLVLAKAIAGYR